LVISIVGVFVIGVSNAFFSDTETSKDNVLVAGMLDLKVDNESYYNGNRCTEVEPEVWKWVGDALYPVPGSACTTSWGLDDLANGRLFFNFLDLKPNDNGEDTISLHVQNEAWVCMDLTLTSNAENGVIEPEILAGDDPNLDGVWDGELAQNMQMVWWADDGDNVLEDGEPILVNGRTAFYTFPIW
jgi:predicted ribosomally synthesized peptide with SipW-like signal peptide